MSFKTPTRFRRHGKAASNPVEPLEGRTYCAVTALSVRGILAVFGDNGANEITLSRDATGRVVVNHGAVRIVGARPTVGTTRLINVFGFDGNDALSVDETGGAMPRANLFGGNGNDTLTGGSANDTVLGGAGNDFLFGAAGADLLIGGDGDDALTGGAADDLVLGQAGNDAFFWSPGDGSDVDEGGDGADTVLVNGGPPRKSSPPAQTAPASASSVPTRRPSASTSAPPKPCPCAPTPATTPSPPPPAWPRLIHLTIDGGGGNDTLIGSDGADDLLGRDGNDVIDGNGGNDLALLGAGDDQFIWNPGDGSDTVEGQDGRDTLAFNGSDDAEQFDLSANGNRARLTRDVGGVAMDLNAVEALDLNALGGADTITVNDQSTTGLNTFNLDLGGAAGAADGQADAVIVNGTDASDFGQIRSIGTRINATVSLIPFVNITGSEGGLDTLTVNTLGGNDVVDASDLAATNASQLIRLTLNGGAGNDALTGSQGNDAFVWNPGDGNDTIEGRAGRDEMVFNGSDLPEIFGISANGNRVRLSATSATSRWTSTTSRRLDVNALGGADKVVVNDLSGTDVEEINLSLAATSGGNAGDGQVDSVIVNGTAAGDLIPVLGTAGGILVNGGFAQAPRSSTSW